jgi:hypothetical protein
VPGVRHPPGDDPQGFGEFDSGEVGTEAVVHAAAEGQHRCRAAAGDVETIGVVLHRRVAVGGRGIGEHVHALRDENAAQFDVGGRDTKCGEGDR